MKGRPLKELIGIAILFGILLIPMLHLTGTTAPTTVLEVEEEQELLILRECWLTLRFAHPPNKVVVTVNDIPLWTLSDQNETRFERTLKLPIIDHRLEMLVQAAWPEGTPETVCEVIVEPDGLAAQTLSVWGEQIVDDIYSFQWESR